MLTVSIHSKYSLLPYPTNKKLQIKCEICDKAAPMWRTVVPYWFSRGKKNMLVCSKLRADWYCADTTQRSLFGNALLKEFYKHNYNKNIVVNPNNNQMLLNSVMRLHENENVNIMFVFGRIHNCLKIIYSFHLYLSIVSLSNSLYALVLLCLRKNPYSVAQNDSIGLFYAGSLVAGGMSASLGIKVNDFRTNHQFIVEM